MNRVTLLVLLGAFAVVGSAMPDTRSGAKGTRALSLWEVAKSKEQVHRYSTLFPAQDVRDRLSTDAGIDAAIDWCRNTAVTKVYIEAFRDGYQAERAALQHARDRFRAADFEVSGCVTTTQVGKPSGGWKGIGCYTDPPTQQKLQSIFEYAASTFDEIMIDDFWFTYCTCPECDAARRAKTVTIGDHTYSVAGDTWEDYRRELMLRVSRDRILGPAKRVNPKVRIIIKYPNWYDEYQERGYDVEQETTAFDHIWVGTETRDYHDPRWGGIPQYGGYFLMRWLGGIGGEKCGGGWYDPYGTNEPTYVEQARQTVLASAGESLLFCYGSLLQSTGPKNIEALRANIPELLDVAEQVRRRRIAGIAAYKPPNSHSEDEHRVFDFVGMLGLPLVPCHAFPADAQAAFFSVHALKDPDLVPGLSAFIAAGKPVLLTDGLARCLAGKLDLGAPNVHVLPVKGDPKALLATPQPELDALRASLLHPFHTSFQAPNQVALYLFRDGSWVVENFRDDPATVELNSQQLTVPARGWIHHWK
jgi:hypothetical protein